MITVVGITPVIAGKIGATTTINMTVYQFAGAELIYAIGGTDGGGIGSTFTVGILLGVALMTATTIGGIDLRWKKGIKISW